MLALSNGKDSVLFEFENGEEIEKIIITEDELFELLSIDV